MARSSKYCAPALYRGDAGRVVADIVILVGEDVLPARDIYVRLGLGAVVILLAAGELDGVCGRGVVQVDGGVDIAVLGSDGLPSCARRRGAGALS